MPALPVRPLSLTNDELTQVILAYLDGQIAASAVQAYLNACSADIPDMSLLMDKINAVTDAWRELRVYLRTHYPV